MQALFLDRSSPLGKLERTPQGGYVAPAKIARTGVMLYSAKQCRAKGMDVPKSFADSAMIRVYMPADVLQAAADTLRNAPVTNEHPPVMVDPTNYRTYNAGNVVADTVKFDGKYLTADLAIQDERLILDIEGGLRQEVSAGYMAATVFSPGRSPEGEAYDAIRELVVYNHTAIVKAGRAGTAVRLQLDSIEEEEQVTMKFKVKGAEVDADKAQAAFDAHEVDLRGQLDASEIKLEAITGERDSLKAELDSVKAELATAKSPAALSAAVDAELERREETKAAEARKATVAKRFPKLDLTKYAQPAIDALHDSIAVEDAKDPDGTDRLNPKGTAPKVGNTDAAADKPKVKRPYNPRAKMLQSYKELDSAVDGETNG